MFLNNPASIATRLTTLIAEHKSPVPIAIAVAFWGQGAETLLSNPRVRFRVVCNMRMGGTNPQVIRRLAEMNNVEVMQLDTLHAKVVAADGGAIVSSANFSSNGLGLEGAVSAAWLEAGVFISRSLPAFHEITQWFSQLWSRSVPITESDLIAAEDAWAKRNVIGHSEAPAALQEGTTLPIVPSDIETGQSSPPPIERLEVQTVHFEGRIKPHQRDLRSAATLVALSGQGGDDMPYSAFVFLFSGGRTRRAFENHQDKFEVVKQSVRLKPAFVGYFVGKDGTLESCTDAKRRKSADAELVTATASWMLRRGPRPSELEGVIESATFFRGQPNEL